MSERKKKSYTERMQKKLADQPEWTPFELSHLADDPEHVRLCGTPHTNSRWQVWIRENVPTGFPHPEDHDEPLCVTHLSIKRHDRGVLLGKDWRDFQRIKNELCGEDCEALEIYPAEKRLVDTANQYHLWVLPAGMLWPIGYDERLVAEEGRGASKQRPFEDDAKPDDLKTKEELAKLSEEAGVVT